MAAEELAREAAVRLNGVGHDDECDVPIVSETVRVEWRAVDAARWVSGEFAQHVVGRSGEWSLCEHTFNGRCPGWLRTKRRRRRPYDLTVSAFAYFATACANAAPSTWTLTRYTYEVDDYDRETGERTSVDEEIDNPFAPIDALNRLGFAIHDFTPDAIQLAYPRLPDAL